MPANFLASGTTSLANGTVQSGYSSLYDKSEFGTSIYIPLRDVSSLSGIPVQQGDVIGVLVQSMNIYSGSQTGVDLTIVETTVAVPEPETYAMMLAGLGLLGFSARHRYRC